MARADCNANSSWFTEYLGTRCQAFTSQVNSARYPNKKTHIYKNRYCLQCIEGHDKVYIPHIEKSVSTFKFLQLPASSTVIKAGKSYLKLAVRSRYTYVHRLLTWESATCYLDGSVFCQIDTCQQTYQKRPDGMCKKTIHLHIGVDMK